MKKSQEKLGAGVFLPIERYDLPIANTPIVQPFESMKIVYDANLDEEVEKNSLIPPLMGEGYNVGNMRQLGFPNYQPSGPLVGYSVNYNCIGWAFDIDAFIEPIVKKDGYVQEACVIDSQLSNFIVQCYKEYENKIPEEGIVSRWFWQPEEEGTSFLVDYKNNHEFQEDDIVFYFGTNEETQELADGNPILLHAARYFDVSRPYKDLYGEPELRWTSKMGDMLLVSHELCDLIGDAYGNPTNMLVTGDFFNY
jgi:hypothetical protein